MLTDILKDDRHTTRSYHPLTLLNHKKIIHQQSKNRDSALSLPCKMILNNPRLMKHHGAILEFTEERNRELMRAFREAISKRTFIDITEISEEVVNAPCPRFWVSEERAMVVVAALIKGKPVLDAMRPTKREMFQEIYKRVMDYQKQFPEASTFKLVMKAVNSPAPKFYMTPRSAMETIYKIKKGLYKKTQ